MYLYLVLTCIIIAKTTAYVQHCIDPTNCQFFPLHSCFATDDGLVCRSRDKPGFEMSVNPAFTLLYTHSYQQPNDTGLPCFSIPITDELINYVDYRGPEVISVDDLPLIGNCSQLSYCDLKTKTCQPKRGLGSYCRQNMHCIFGEDGIPGHCNHSVCATRTDLPAYYYDSARQWKMGDEWPAAALALVVSGAVVLLLLVGRYLIPIIWKKIKAGLEQWQNKSESQCVVDEQSWNEQHKWWKQVPGIHWVYNRLKRSNTEYYQLDSRTQEEPPPYRAD